MDALTLAKCVRLLHMARTAFVIKFDRRMSSADAVAGFLTNLG